MPARSLLSQVYTRRCQLSGVVELFLVTLSESQKTTLPRLALQEVHWEHEPEAMNGTKPVMHNALLLAFMVNMIAAVVMGLMLIWGFEPTILFGRILGTCTVLAFAAAFSLGATRFMKMPK